MSNGQSGKGKDKDDSVIVLSDSDSDVDFFKSKKKINTRPLTPPRSLSPSRASASSDSEDLNGEKKIKKKKRTTKPPSKSLPAWTRTTSAEHRDKIRKGSAGRGSTEERRQESSVVVINDDSDDDVIVDGNKNGRKRVQITPPPALTEKRKALLLQTLAERGLGGRAGAGDNPLIIDDDEDGAGSSSPPRKVTEDQIIKIVVIMQADEERKSRGSEAALREWQKRRVFRFCKTDPLSRLLEILAHSMGQVAEDLVLEHNNDRIYNRTTPEDLRLEDMTELFGYTKVHYDQVLRERRAKLLMGDDDDEDHNGGVGDTSIDINARYPNSHLQGDSNSALESLNQTRPQDDEKIRLHVRGQEGEVRTRATRITTAEQILKFYLKKTNRPQSDLKRLRLVLDGESIPLQTKVGEMDVEDGDLLEVQG